MIEKCFLAAVLAFKDWHYEKSLSFCAVLALASMLVPILSLMGVKNGVISTMRERLLEDPMILIITPKSDAGKYDAEFIRNLSNLPGAAFVIGRTRETTTDVTFVNERSGTVSIGLEPAAKGEPVLAHFSIMAPEDGKQPQIVLSASAAKKLAVQKDSVVTARLGRRTPQGKFESEKINFLVSGILPREAGDRVMGFVPLQVMEDMEDFRDYIEVPEREFSGNPKSSNKNYASFRLYAKNLDAVENLASELAGMRIETITRAREIAGIRQLEEATNQVILIISIAVGAGFIAFTLSSAKGAVARKKRMLGMLRLLGFPSLALTLYPVVQAMLIALCGLVLSFILYAVVSYSIGNAFSQQGTLACRLAPADIILVVGSVIVLSLLATIRSACVAGNMEPSSVIRDNG